mgnify:CR=1 FL=1
MIPFSWLLESNEVQADMTLDMMPSLEQLGISLLGNGEIEVKAVLAFRSFLRGKVTFRNMDSVEEKEIDYKVLEQRPGIIGYIVKEGDELWNLAKYYGTTKEGIMDINHMESEQLKCGDKLLIFKENASYTVGILYTRRGWIRGEKVMDKMELKALGKINLGLDVLGRRENGYHDVRMVMQTVYLYDQIRIEKTKKPGIELSTNLFYLPVNENNLAYQAADLLMKEFDVKEGVKITLDKHIPVAAGMAGGSSNAAAVLFGINRMFSLGLSQKELMERGVTLGADVPYCVMRGTVLAEGIGEILTPLPACPKCHVLIAKPPISVSTKLVYEKLDSHEIEDHPDIDGIIDGLKAHDIEKVASSMGNVLEKVTIEEYPVIEQIKNVMKEQGALNAMMSGSGPTVFGIYDSKEKARKAAAKIREKQLAKQVYVTGIHNARRK